MVRGLPGALVLGLLASFLAHAVLFGGDHAMGGAYHGALLQAAAAGGGGLLAFLLALGVLGARGAADGSVLAMRLAKAMPNFPALLLATGGWFALGERLEPAHGAAPVILTVVLLALAAWLTHHLGKLLSAVVAQAILAVFTSPFAARVPAFVRQTVPAPRTHRSPVLRRRFARPPPTQPF